MKYYKIMHEREQVWALQQGDQYHILDGLPYDAPQKTGEVLNKAQTKVLAPTVHETILAVGANYMEHIKESGREAVAPDDPVLFVKLQSSIIANDEPIVLPANVGRIDFEAEIAVMVGCDLKDADRISARKAVFGVTCCNDVSAREIQKKDGQWIRAKNFPTFCPMGPCIQTDVDIDNLKISLNQNGEQKQKSHSGMMIFKIDELLSFISKHIPLRKGDIVTTGTPEGVGPLAPNDVVEIEIEGVGVLRNPVQ